MNPYSRLKKIGTDWALDVTCPTRKVMWHYPKATLGDGWRLNDLAERVAAAKQLGYSVVLSVNDACDLVATYQKDPPPVPWEFRP